MASVTCLRCLRHSLQSLSLANTALTPHRAAFSTTPQLLGDGKTGKKKKKGTPGTPATRGKKNIAQRQRAIRPSRSAAPVARQRASGVGERKAMKKRIVLSNTNALEVHGLEDLTASKLVRESSPGQTRWTLPLDRYRGHVLGVDGPTVDGLRALESFKATQAWSLFRRPASVVRHDTIKLAAHMMHAETASPTDKSRRRMIHGPKGSGKSVLLLQAHAMALVKGWFVVHFPEAQDLVNAHTSYQPLDSPDGRLYIQPHYTAKLLANCAKANAALLDSLQLTQTHRLPIPVQPNISLARFVNLGAQDPDLAWPVWQALWSELLTPSSEEAGHRRPPILVTMDGIDQIMRPSAYLDANANPIHAHDLALPRYFVDLLAGRTTLPNGGLVLGATCSSNRASSPTLDRYLHNIPASANPYAPVDERVRAVLEKVPSVRLEGLTKEEARGLMEYYARSGMLRKTITEGLVSEQWALAGSGIIGELERATVRMRFGADGERTEAQ